MWGEGKGKKCHCLCSFPLMNTVSSLFLLDYRKWNKILHTLYGQKYANTWPSHPYFLKHYFVAINLLGRRSTRFFNVAGGNFPLSHKIIRSCARIFVFQFIPKVSSGVEVGALSPWAKVGVKTLNGQAARPPWTTVMGSVMPEQVWGS